MAEKTSDFAEITRKRIRRGVFKSVADRSADADNEIDLDALPHITEEDLKEIGVALGARRKLFAEIAKLSESVESATAKERSDDRSADAEAERRQLTVMFCDLVGSTALSERLDPEDLREVIRAYQDVCAEAIGQYDGYLAKYLGDGVLAYFGYPQAHEDDAARGVRAGLAILDAMKPLNARLQAQMALSLAVRVGIHTGLVVAGEMGGGDVREERAIVGETPNVAARLEGLAEPDGIVIGPLTHKLVVGQFDCRALGPRSVKGISDPIPVYAVRGELRIASRFEATHGAGLDALVGREREVGFLLDRWERAKEGAGQVVVLSGEAGVGKSRIMQEIRNRICGERHVGVSYQCSPYHTDSALYPAIDQLEWAARFVREDSPERKLDKLEALLASSETPLEEVAPLLAAMLSLPVEGRYGPLGLTPQRQKQKTLEALTAHLFYLGKRDPILFLVEDAQWIDPPPWRCST